MKLNNFMYSYVLAHMLYGIEMDDNEFQEIALIAWNLIGNKRYRLYRTCLNVNQEDGSVELPCEVDYIEAVTKTSEDYQVTTNHTNFNNYNSSFSENYIEALKYNENPFYIAGGFVKYTEHDGKIYVDKRFHKINILYKHVEVDEDGLPKITDKEANAIAVYVAYIVQYKKSLLTQNANMMQIAGVLKTEWQQKCDAARVDKDMWSQNDMDKILDVVTTFNRKLYGKSFKPLQ